MMKVKDCTEAQRNALFETYSERIKHDAYEYYASGAQLFAEEKLKILGAPLQRYEIDEYGAHGLTFKDGDAETLLGALDSYVHDYSASDENIAEIAKLHKRAADARKAYHKAEEADDEPAMEAAESLYEKDVCEEVQEFYKGFLQDEISSEYNFYYNDFDNQVKEYYRESWLEMYADDSLDPDAMTIYETKAVSKSAA